MEKNKSEFYLIAPKSQKAHFFIFNWQKNSDDNYHCFCASYKEASK